MLLFASVVLFASARRNAEDRLRQQETLRETLDRERAAPAEAEEASRLKDEFLATVSHELRTPLNAILGWSATLNRHDVDEETKAQALRTIERNAQAQARIVDDILDFSGIASGRLRIDPSRSRSRRSSATPSTRSPRPRHSNRSRSRRTSTRIK